MSIDSAIHHSSTAGCSTPATVLRFPATAGPDPRQLGDEHPAARLSRCGAATLSDAELLTLVTRSRVRTEADLRPARALLQDGLAALIHRAKNRDASLRSADVVRLSAAMELARRALLGQGDERERFHVDVAGPRLAAQYAFHVQEHLGVLLLDSRDRLIAQQEVFVGTLHSAFVSPRDIIRSALTHHAAGIVIYHNHPSGDTSVSAEDLAFTSRLRTAASLLDVKLVDHLIVGGSRFLSFQQRGYL